MCKNLVYLTAVLLMLLVAAGVQAKIIYVDATDGEAGNTTFATGEVFAPSDPGTAGSGADGLWRKRVFANSGTIFESGGSWEADLNTEDCPRLVTTINVPEADYEVFVYFWADTSQWRIQAALADAAGDLPLFLANDPNGVAKLADEKDFDAPVPMLAEGNRTLWQVSLGTTGVTTSISVYVDDDPNHLTGNSRTWYDGIGIKALAPQINYVDATEGEAGNTTLAAGGVFTSVADQSGADNLWRGRAFANGGTIFESGGQYGDTANPEDCPRLVTSVTVPENEYAVYVYFWSDTGQWPIQAAMADAAGDLPLYKANDPNGVAKQADVNDFAAAVMVVEGNRTLWQVFLGNTGRTTSISVFVDDVANHLSHTARTWYDGIGYKVITPIHYVDAMEGDTGNTRLASGDVFNAVEVGNDGSGDDGLWRRRPGFGNGTCIYESGGDYRNAPNNAEDCPRLVTTVDVRENIYEVFAYFWDTNSSWQLRASLTNDVGELPLYLPNDPNGAATAAVEADFAAPVPIVTSSGGRIMWQIPLGMTGMTTQIAVYADDDAGHLESGKRTWYDGIGYRVASLYTPDAPPEPLPEPEPEPLPEPVDPGTAGLVAYYMFEDNANDASVNGLNGTIVGDPIFVDGPTGYGKALDFSNDYIDCGNSPLFDITEAITVAAWVNIRAASNAWAAVISKGDAAWRISANGTTQGMHFGFEDGTRGWMAANSTAVLPLNEWHHVCGTYDKTNGARIYIDGRVEGTNADKLGITLSTWNVYIGENAQQTGRLWNGLIDEVMVFNRALSGGEVVYLAGK